MGRLQSSMHLPAANGEPVKLREIAPLSGATSTAAIVSRPKLQDGRVVRFGYDPYPFMLFEPVPWWWSSAWLLPLWIASLVALGLTVLAWPFLPWFVAITGLPMG